MSLGALTFRVVSEAMSLRAAVEARLGPTVDRVYAREGLLIGRPGLGEAGEKAAWMAYESGEIVLRRSRREQDVVEAAVFHLIALRSAVESPLLPLRLRTVMLDSGSAVLVDPRAIYDVAGHDRWYAAHGCDVLPTTIALVDPATVELILPEQDVDDRVPTGRHRIEEFILRRGEESPLGGADVLLALAAVVVRDRERDLQPILEQIDRLVTDHGDRVRLLPRGEITDAVKQYAHRQEE